MNQKGQMGEMEAARYLRKKGYRILDANYHSRFGEIDLIAEKNGFLAFVEVKARARETFMAARESVTKTKQQKIIRTALLYLSENPMELQPRFDVIEVIGSPEKDCKITHMENAFTV